MRPMLVALHEEGGQACIQVFFFRADRTVTALYFPSQTKGLDAADLIAAFLGQFYEKHPPPRQVILSHTPAQRNLISEALTIRARRRVDLLVPKRGAKKRAVDHAATNARDALKRRMAESVASTAYGRLGKPLGPRWGS